MLALLPLTACAFSAPGLSPLVGHACMPSRAAVFAKAAEVADAVAMDAAANVLKASKKFGKPQVAAAQKWIESALAGEQSVSLMEQKLTLFEQCQLDDESGVCKELDAALTSLEDAAAARGGKPKPSTPSAMFDAIFKGDPVQNAVNRVKKAAGAFGPEQKKAADEWIQKTMAREVTDGGASLLNEQVLLFGECMLSEDGTPSKCEALQDALSEMQSALGDAAFQADADAEAEVCYTGDPLKEYEKDFGEAPEGYCYDQWGRLILTKMGK